MADSSVAPRRIKIGTCTYLFDESNAEFARRLRTQHNLARTKPLAVAQEMYHRLTGRPPIRNEILMHLNGDSRDFRFSNLVPTTRQAHCRENFAQRSRQPREDAGLSVTASGRVRARLYQGGKTVELGLHPDRNAALDAKHTSLKTLKETDDQMACPPHDLRAAGPADDSRPEQLRGVEQR